MASICPICKKPVKINQSPANIPVGEVNGHIVTQLCHLDCIMKTPLRKLERLFPYYYKTLKEGKKDNFLPQQEGGREVKEQSGS